MNTVVINTRLTAHEKEMHILQAGTDGTIHVDTTIQKYANKLKKQEWKQTAEYVYDDGTPCGGAFEAPEWAITFRNPNKKRVMSDEQMKNLHRHDEED